MITRAQVSVRRNTFFSMRCENVSLFLKKKLYKSLVHYFTLIKKKKKNTSDCLYKNIRISRSDQIKSPQFDATRNVHKLLLLLLLYPTNFPSARRICFKCEISTRSRSRCSSRRNRRRISRVLFVFKIIFMRIVYQPSPSPFLPSFLQN